MKYSKELHERVLQRIRDHGDVISFGTPFVECLLGEISRLQAENKQYQNIFDIQKMTIERLQAERRWIPVSERLPERKDDYLAVTEGARDKYGDVSVWIEVVEFYSECGHWGCGIDRFVTHWMPLPEPPDES